MIVNVLPANIHYTLAKKINIDIFFASEDITALRWLNDLFQRVKPYQELININLYQLGSKESRKLNITTDTVIVNEQRVSVCKLEKILLEMASSFVKR